jgi:hypothetical protein
MDSVDDDMKMGECFESCLDPSRLEFVQLGTGLMLGA